MDKEVEQEIKEVKRKKREIKLKRNGKEKGKN